MSRDQSSAGIAATTAITPVIWGTTYLTTTEFLPDGRPLLAATIRALPIGVLFVARRRLLPSGDWWWRAAVLGLLNIGIFFPLLFLGAMRLPGGVAATAGAIQPLVAASIAALFFGEAFGARTAIAGAAGVAGVALLVLGPDAALDPVGVAASLGGAASMATGVALTKQWGRPVDLLTFTGWQLTAGGVFLVPILLAFEGVPSSLSGRNLVGFAWFAVAGTGIAYSNWFRGVQLLPVAVSSLLSLLSPVIAAALGWLVLDQRLTAVQLAGAALVLAAVVSPHLPTARRPAPVRDGSVNSTNSQPIRRLGRPSPG